MDIFQELKEIKTLAENTAKSPLPDGNAVVLFEIAYRTELILKFLTQVFPELDVKEM